MNTPSIPRPILVIDFGSQFAHLITNRLRRLKVASEILPSTASAEEIQERDPIGIILSGGPKSVTEVDSPQLDPEILNLDIPILGICYGHQILTHMLGGELGHGPEYGPMTLEIQQSDHPLMRDISPSTQVYMNHGDTVTTLPPGAELLASTHSCPFASFAITEKKILTLQHHPEVTHSTEGMQMLQNFCDICGAEPNWGIEEAYARIQEELSSLPTDRKVFMLVSGGVDSSVAFWLLGRELGAERVHGLYIDTGLMRQDETQEVRDLIQEAGLHLDIIDASDVFFEALEGVTDPEEKRSIIGKVFLQVQAQQATELGLDGPEWMLGQGTIYPDHIESGGSQHASTIKTHHNRIPQILQMIEEGRVIEPLRDLYKDEVRNLGALLGMSERMLQREPFPGPGLGVRVLCQREAEESPVVDLSSLEYSARLLPVRSVGVQGDARSYRHPLALSAPLDRAQEILARTPGILNSLPQANRLILSTHEAQLSEIISHPDSFMTRDRVELLQEADARVRSLMRQHPHSDVWQFPVVLAPFGLEGAESIILRPISSLEAMTAQAVLLPTSLLEQITTSLLGISRISHVFLDLTSKPPGTIEWE